jgi:hypothetical protein
MIELVSSLKLWFSFSYIVCSRTDVYDDGKTGLQEKEGKETRESKRKNDMQAEESSSDRPPHQHNAGSAWA